MKTPRYWPCIFFGLILLVITFLITLPLKHASSPLLKLPYGLVHDRGAISYIMLWIGFSVFCATIKALRRPDLRRGMALILIIISLFPLPLGAYATYAGLTQIRAKYAMAVATAENQEDLARFEQWRANSIGIAWDSTVLAVLILIPNIGLSIALWVRNSERK